MANKFSFIFGFSGIGFVLALIGFVLGLFSPYLQDACFHNPLYIKRLRSFEHPANWVCFAEFVIFD